MIIMMIMIILLLLIIIMIIIVLIILILLLFIIICISISFMGKGSATAADFWRSHAGASRRRSDIAPPLTSSIFEARGSKNPLPSSFFGAEDRRTPCYLRSSTPKIVEPPIFVLRTRRSKNPPPPTGFRLPASLSQPTPGGEILDVYFISSRIAKGPNPNAGRSIYIASRQERRPLRVSVKEKKESSPRPGPLPVAQALLRARADLHGRGPPGTPATL